MCNCYGLTRVTEQCEDICKLLGEFYTERDSIMSDVLTTPLKLRLRIQELIPVIVNHLIQTVDTINWRMATIHNKYLVPETDVMKFTDVVQPQLIIGLGDDPYLRETITVGTRTKEVVRVPKMERGFEVPELADSLAQFMYYSTMWVVDRGAVAEVDYRGSNYDYIYTGVVFIVEYEALTQGIFVPFKEKVLVHSVKLNISVDPTTGSNIFWFRFHKSITKVKTVKDLETGSDVQATMTMLIGDVEVTNGVDVWSEPARLIYGSMMIGTTPYKKFRGIMLAGVHCTSEDISKYLPAYLITVLQWYQKTHSTCIPIY
jgi:hypothetical protein